jgi:hypothetical protein
MRKIEGAHSAIVHITAYVLNLLYIFTHCTLMKHGLR